uniref:Uncharacterized protein n=1 Tax=Anguilla anguilla TaxID=7936 RepID=A0A0E9QDR5_ANGAN
MPKLYSKNDTHTQCHSLSLSFMSFYKCTVFYTIYIK